MEPFEGDGPWKEYSSRVAAVCGLYGPADLMALEEKPPFSEPEGILERLLGGSVQENKRKAAMASPVKHVSSDDPAFLIVHGEEDPLVPYEQSAGFYTELKANGVEATLHLAEGAGHGTGFGKDTVDIITGFFIEELKRP
jgi:acetyl esterase/lipase